MIETIAQVDIGLILVLSITVGPAVVLFNIARRLWRRR